MVPSAPRPPGARVDVVGLGESMLSLSRAVQHLGLLLTDLVIGAKVEVGQLRGTVVAIGGHVLEEVLAPSEAWAMAVKRRPRPDDLVICLATTDE